MVVSHSFGVRGSGIKSQCQTLRDLGYVMSRDRQVGLQRHKRRVGRYEEETARQERRAGSWAVGGTER